MHLCLSNIRKGDKVTLSVMYSKLNEKKFSILSLMRSSRTAVIIFQQINTNIKDEKLTDTKQYRFETIFLRFACHSIDLYYSKIPSILLPKSVHY